MKQATENLIEALREELKQYGEMLALLEHQQQLVVLRQAADLLQNVSAVDAQAELIRAARQEREQRSRTLARRFALEEAAGIKLLAPRLPAEYRPLVLALAQENNELLMRIQHRARLNQMLLNQAVDLMQRFINTLIPGAASPTYSEAGKALPLAVPQTPLYEAIG